MAINSVRTALQLLTGAGEVTRAKALEAAGTLLELPGVGGTSARAGQLAEELIEAATANQAMITELVRTELDRRLVVLGLARGSDLEAAQRKIDALEAEVAALRAGMAEPASATSDVPTAPQARASRSAIRTTAAGPAPASPSGPAKRAIRAPAKAAKTTAPRPAKKVAPKAPAAGTKKAAAKKAGARKPAATKATKAGTKKAAKRATVKTTTKKTAVRAQ